MRATERCAGLETGRPGERMDSEPGYGMTRCVASRQYDARRGRRQQDAPQQLASEAAEGLASRPRRGSQGPECAVEDGTLSRVQMRRRLGDDFLGRRPLALIEQLSRIQKDAVISVVESPPDLTFCYR